MLSCPCVWGKGFGTVRLWENTGKWNCYTVYNWYKLKSWWSNFIKYADISMSTSHILREMENWKHLKQWMISFVSASRIQSCPIATAPKFAGTPRSLGVGLLWSALDRSLRSLEVANKNFFIIIWSISCNDFVVS